MSAEEINVAIVDVCGWTRCETCPTCDYWYPPGANKQSGMEGRHVPNYCGDLNAMAEVEKFLTNDQRRFYVDVLVLVHPLHYHPLDLSSDDGNMRIFLIASMSASQRAEAFLRTLGLWKE